MKHANPEDSTRSANHADALRELCSALDRVAKDPVLRNEDGRRPWTREVKTALCRWGLSQGFYVYAHSIRDRFREVPKKRRPQYEWLFDVTCLTYNGRYLDRVPLVAECEWGNEDDIYDDFEKLLLARAEIRVMVFDADQLNSENKFRKFEKYVGRCTWTQPEDTYLLAAYTQDRDGFDYRLIEGGKLSRLP